MCTAAVQIASPISNPAAADAGRQYLPGGMGLPHPPANQASYLRRGERGREEGGRESERDREIKLGSELKYTVTKLPYNLRFLLKKH